MTQADNTLLSAQNHQRIIWQYITNEARCAVREQPDMEGYYHTHILSHNCFADAVAFFLASHLADSSLSAMTIQSAFQKAMAAEPGIVQSMLNDLLAHYNRDAACNEYMLPLLCFKGYHALQSYRIAHYYWRQQRLLLAVYLQHRIAALFDVDIHPAAVLGSGIMLDHATAIVIGETAVVDDDVSILQGVTLGGSGADTVKRHPSVGRGVLIGAGAKLLGDITIGECVKVGAGSLVVSDVAPHTTVVGVPAREVNSQQQGVPAAVMDHTLDG